MTRIVLYSTYCAGELRQETLHMCPIDAEEEEEQTKKKVWVLNVIRDRKKHTVSGNSTCYSYFFLDNHLRFHS